MTGGILRIGGKSPFWRVSLFFVAVLSILIIAVVPSKNTVLYSQDVLEEHHPSRSTPLVVHDNFAYAISHDEKHILRRSLRQGPWSSVFSVPSGRLDGLCADSKFLYTIHASPGEPTAILQISLGNGFEKAFPSLGLRSPTSIGIAGNYLFLLESGPQLVVIDSNKWLPMRMDLAVAADSLAIEHLRIAASSDQLILSDEDSGLLVALANPTSASGGALMMTDLRCQAQSETCSASFKQIASAYLKTTKGSSTYPGPTHPGPLVIRRGVFYVVDAASHEVFASSTHRFTPARLVYDYQHKLGKAASIAATDDSLVLLDENSNLTVWPIIVPAEVTTGVQTSEGMSALYNYLYKRYLLPTKSVPLIDSMESTLRSAGALKSPYVASLDPVICGLNPSICKHGHIKQTNPINKPVLVPDVYSESFIDVKGIALDGSQNLTQVSNNLIRSQEFFPWKAEERIQKLNPSWVSSNEHQTVPILTAKEGHFYLPAERVRFILPFPRDAFASPKTYLAKIEAAFKPDLTVFSLEEIAGTPQQVITSPTNGEENARQAAKALAQTINYQHPNTQESPQSNVGVAEDPIDCDSPTLKNVCIALPGEIPAVPQSIPRQSALNTLKLRDYSKFDHGTAVAGLIAGRVKFISLGLVAPESFVVPLFPKEPRIADDIQSAVLIGTRVFNISQSFEDQEGIPKKLIATIERDPSQFPPALFIVSAPDNGQPAVSSGNFVYPIGLANRANVIGVAATTLDGKTLLPDNSPWSWGKDYVQIAAPGAGFMAPGQDGFYVPVAGTSFAAPLVTAAAEALFEEGIDDPVLIKQRILSTATLVPAYADKVGFGLLNFGRAVMNVRRGVLVAQGDDPNTGGKAVLVDTGVSIWVKTSNAQARPINLGDVLRLTLKNEGTYRIVFRNHDPNKPAQTRLEVLDDATFPDQAPWKIKYREFASPSSPPGPIVLDDLIKYRDYFGPIK